LPNTLVSGKPAINRALLKQKPRGEMANTLPVFPVGKYYGFYVPVHWNSILIDQSFI
jgi:hypothetical protein